MYVKKYAEFPESIKLYKHDVPLPDPPDKKSDILNHNLPTSKQMWRREELPACWSNEHIEEEALDRGWNPDKYAKKNIINWWMDDPSDEMLRFAEDQWHKRKQGLWLYINGKPTYITGLHWYYLQWFKFDGIRPDYRDRDRRWWLMWNYVENEPTTSGMIYLKHRRDGATGRGGCILLEYATSHKTAFCGLQTKVGTQALKTFSRMVVDPFKEMPYFFQPISSGTDDPKNGLFFKRPPRRRSHHDLRVQGRDTLNSEITHRNTVFNAYDGDKLHRYLGDEWGKTEEMNVIKTWGVLRPSLTDPHRPGKALIPTTAEDMDYEPGKRFRTVWDNSAIEVMDANGETTSRLLQYFAPSYDGLTTETKMWFGPFGESLIDEAKEYLDNRRAHLKAIGDIKGLAEAKRLFPYEPEDALRDSGKGCQFDADRINDTLDQLYATLPDGRRSTVKYGVNSFNLHWSGEPYNSPIIASPEKDGRWVFRYIPHPDNKNKSGDKLNAIYRQKYGDMVLVKPQQTAKFVIGVDPINRKIDDMSTNALSQAAATLFYKYNPELDGGKPEEEWQTHSWIGWYRRRPRDPEIFFEDMLRACYLFGCMFHAENDKGGIFTYFRNRGFGPFIQYRPDNTKTNHSVRQEVPGTPASNLTAQIGTDYLDTWISKHLFPHTCPFPELLEDWLKFQFDKRTKFDLTMASLMTIIPANVPTKQSTTHKNEARKVSYLPTYKMPSRKLNYGRS